MDMHQRDEEIWRLRNEGVTYSRIGKQFDLSLERVRQICRQRKEKIERFGKWPPLRRELSMRTQNVLVKVFGNEDIFNHPEKLASLGEEAFYKWKNIGKKSLTELIDVLEKLGYSVNRNMRMADMKSQAYFNIGKRILQKYFDYYIENSLDDTEYIPVVRLIIEGIAEQMLSAGMLAPSCSEVAKKLKDFNRVLYQNRWIEQAKEDQAPGEDPFDLEEEHKLAKRTFDYIYKHGEHPE